VNRQTKELKSSRRNSNYTFEKKASSDSSSRRKLVQLVKD